jgi:hypothetical protein
MKAFSGAGSKADDILMWASQIEAIGEALCCLSRNEDFWFQKYGEHIGGIISQYAQAIYETVKEGL